MKDFLIWVVASIGSLFGIHSSPVTPPVSAPVQVVRTQTNSALAQPATTDTSNNAQQSSAVTQDCGTIINTPPNSGQNTPQALQNTASYTCMSKAVVSCSPATLNVPEPISGLSSSIKFQNEIFTVLPSTGQYCPVEKQDTSVSSYSMTCNIPSDLLSDIVTELQPKNQMQYLFFAVQTFFSPKTTPTTQKGQVIDPQTKQSVHIQCSDNSGATWLGTQ